MSLRYGSLYDRLDRDTIPEPNSGCWLFFGCCDENGYGRIRVGDHKERAHRISYERHNGPIASWAHIRHKCDNPPCINPEHLVSGTAFDNIVYKVTRNRQARGEMLPCHKLTEADVMSIYTDDRTQRIIAKEYGVTHGVIGRIKRGKKWAYLYPSK